MEAIEPFVGTGTEQEKKKVEAYWQATLDVKCPYCGHIVDILDTDEWSNDWAYKFGKLETRTKIDAEVQCPNCKLIFEVENVIW